MKIDIKEYKEEIESKLILGKQLYIDKALSYEELEEVIRKFYLKQVNSNKNIEIAAMLSYLKNMNFKVIELNEYIFEEERIIKKYLIRE